MVCLQKNLILPNTFSVVAIIRRIRLIFDAPSAQLISISKAIDFTIDLSLMGQE